MAIKAVIFDFDGVIADSEPCHLAAFNQVFAEFGIEISSEIYYSTYLGFIRKKREIDQWRKEEKV